LIGGLLAQFASVIDGCDGEVARLKYLESAYGGWFDTVLDRYADAFMLFGLTLTRLCRKNVCCCFSGRIYSFGSFMLSYTADKYDRLMRASVESGKRIRIGRDMRVFLIFLCAVCNQPLVALLIIAVLMNAETLRRVLVCRDH